MSLRFDIIDHAAPTWPADLVALWAALGAPHNLELLPRYFVQTSFVRMGGRILRITDDDGLRGVALLFPRGVEGERRVYTLRVSDVGGVPDGALIRAWQDVRKILTHNDAHAPEFGIRLPPNIVPYWPGNAKTYAATHQQFGAFDIGAPGAEELPAIRTIRTAIWGVAPSDQFPSDLHSAEFGPGTSLVARADDALVGFLLGFYRFDGLDNLAHAGVDVSLSIESQVMGVIPRLRRAGLAATLKRAQAVAARERGIGVIHWTADPLQFPNATLNFHKLRAVAGEFYPDFYPFQNKLNRVPASRFGITWLPATTWGRAGLADDPRRERGLDRFPGCVILNEGTQILATPHGAPHVAIEIPADWTTLQHDDLDTAAAWRTAADTILAEIVGLAPGRYLIADVAMAGDRRYLIGHAFDAGMIVGK